MAAATFEGMDVPYLRRPVEGKDYVDNEDFKVHGLFDVQEFLTRNE